MKTIGKSLLLLVFVAYTSSFAGEKPERGSAEEAQHMVDRAIQLFDEVGADEAFIRFSRSGTSFKDRDLYIFVVGPDNHVVAHAENRDRIGLDASTVKDSTGANYGQKIIDDATAEGVWVDYIRKDPLTGDELQKSSWLRRHAGYIFGVGIYK